MNFLIENIYIIWFIVAFIFIVGELFLPGFVVFFFGVAALIVAFETMIFEINPSFQIIQFIVFSGILLFIFHKFFRKEQKQLSSFDAETKNQLVKVIQDILPPQYGKVIFRGSEWSAESHQKILAGEMAEIVSHESIRLVVRKKKNFD